MERPLGVDGMLGTLGRRCNLRSLHSSLGHCMTRSNDFPSSRIPPVDGFPRTEVVRRRVTLGAHAAIGETEARGRVPLLEAHLLTVSWLPFEATCPRKARFRQTIPSITTVLFARTTRSTMPDVEDARRSSAFHRHRQSTDSTHATRVARTRIRCAVARPTHPRSTPMR